MKIKTASINARVVHVRDMEPGEVYRSETLGTLYIRTDESEWPLLAVSSGILCDRVDCTEVYSHVPSATLTY
jgi:hypothetical protein